MILLDEFRMILHNFCVEEPPKTAQALHDYWAPKFQEATTSPTLTAKYILPHAQTTDPDLYDWTATYDNMIDVLARQPDTVWP